MNIVRFRTLSTVLAVLLLGACAPAATVDEIGLPAPEAAALDVARVEVHHNVPTAVSATVHLVTPAGTRHRLGNVAPGMTQTLTFEGMLGEGHYRLVAETADGRTLTSPVFSLHPRGVRWDMDLNRVSPVIEGG